MQEEAIAYYTAQEAKLREEYKNERERLNTKPLDMAFVTFQNETMTARWVSEAVCFVVSMNMLLGVHW